MPTKKELQEQIVELRQWQAGQMNFVVGINIDLKKEITKLKAENEKLKEENSDIKKVRDIKIKRSQDKQQKYIHYKNLVLEHELDDVSDFEDDDYMGFGEKPFRKD